MTILDEGTLHISSKAAVKYKVEVNVEELVPGMEIAENIFNDWGAIIIAENSILDHSLIKGLNMLGIKRIKTYRKAYDVWDRSFEEFKIRYTQNLILIREVIQDLYTGKPLDMGKINAITRSINEKNYEGIDILKFIGEGRVADEYIYTHCINVAMLSMLIARWLRLGEEETEEVEKAGLLHDIGKSRIAPSIVNKPGPLLPHEFEEIKKHPAYGYEILKGVEGLPDEICRGVLMHHEREDGSGYPAALKRESISEYARIIAVADIYDAMTSDRTYLRKQSPFSAFEYLESVSLKELDTRITEVFLENAPSFYVGEKFFLNSGEICEIVFIDPKKPSKPLIKIGERYVDLSRDRSLFIERMI